MKGPGNGVPLAAFGLVVWAFGLPIFVWQSGAPWYMAAVVFLSLIVAAFIGHEIALWNLRRDGYVVEMKPDVRGKSRYRVGVAEPPTAMPAVRWIAPGDPDAVPDRVKLSSMWDPEAKDPPSTMSVTAGTGSIPAPRKRPPR